MKIEEKDITLTASNNDKGLIDIDIKFTPQGALCVNAVVALSGADDIEDKLKAIIMDEVERVNDTADDILDNVSGIRQDNLEKVAELSIAAILKYVNGKLDARVIN